MLNLASRVLGRLDVCGRIPRLQGNLEIVGLADQCRRRLHRSAHFADKIRHASDEWEQCACAAHERVDACVDGHAEVDTESWHPGLAHDHLRSVRRQDECVVKVVGVITVNGRQPSDDVHVNPSITQELETLELLTLQWVAAVIGQGSFDQCLRTLDVCVAGCGMLIPRFRESQSQRGGDRSLVCHAVVPDTLLDVAYTLSLVFVTR